MRKQSLKEIKSKITRFSYSGLNKFKADMKLMLDNARVYNASESVGLLVKTEENR